MDDQVYVDDRTIDSHIKRLRKKMRMVDDEFSADRNLIWHRIPLQRRVGAGDTGGGRYGRKQISTPGRCRPG